MKKRTDTRSRPVGSTRARRSLSRVTRPEARTGAATSSSGSTSAGAAGTRHRQATAARSTTFSGRLRRFVPVVLIPDLIALGIVVVIALMALLATGAEMGSFALLSGQLWMLGVVAPIHYQGIEVSYLPLIPAMVLIAMQASRIHSAIRERVSVNDLLVLTACVLVIPSLLTSIMWLVVRLAAEDTEFTAPLLLSTIWPTFLIHILGLILGMGQRLWHQLAKRYSIPPALIDGAVLALRFLSLLAGAAVLIALIALVINFGNQRAVLEQYPNIDGYGIAGLVLISVLYLPNAVLGIMAVLMGSEFRFDMGGDIGAGISLFDVYLVPLPPVPLAGIIPPQANEWAPALMLVPAAIVIWVMYRARVTWVHACGAIIGAALWMSIATVLGSGVLGVYGIVGPVLGLSVLLAMVWAGGGGLAVAAASQIAHMQMCGAEGERGAEEEYEEEPKEESNEVSEESVEKYPADQAPEETVSGDPAPEEPAEETTTPEETPGR